MSGLSQQAWLVCPGLRAPPRCLLFTPAAGAGARGSWWGRSRVTEDVLGFSPQREAAQLGAQGKAPG